MATCATYFLGMMLMFQPNGAITIEPGKQLPQSVDVRLHADSGMREQKIHYMLFTPRGYGADNKQWPLMLFLHGLGECGDNELERVKIHGPASFVDSRPDFPFIVVTPQCPPPKGEMKDVPTAWKPAQLIQLVDHIENNLNVDRTRVYVTGLS